MINQRQFGDMLIEDGLVCKNYESAKALKVGMENFLDDDFKIWLSYGDRTLGLTDSDALYPLTNHDRANVCNYLHFVDSVAKAEEGGVSYVGDGRIHLEHLDGRLHTENNGDFVMHFGLGEYVNWGIDFHLSAGELGKKNSTKISRHSTLIDDVAQKCFGL